MACWRKVVFTVIVVLVQEASGRNTLGRASDLPRSGAPSRVRSSMSQDAEGNNAFSTPRGRIATAKSNRKVHVFQSRSTVASLSNEQNDKKSASDVVNAVAAAPPSSPPIPLEDLPETVGYFKSNGCHVYLQGVIHGSLTSATEVYNILRDARLEGQLKYIVVELDFDRYLYLQSRRKGTRRDRSKTAWEVFNRILEDPSQKAKGQALLGLLLSTTMRAGESLEFEKGVDFLAAMDVAEERDIPLVLADQPTNSTVDAMFGEFSIRSMPTHLAQLRRNLLFLATTLRRSQHGTVTLRSALGRLPRAAQIFLTFFSALAASSELPFDWNVAAKHNVALDGLANIERWLLIYVAFCLPRVLKVLFTQRDIRMLSSIEALTEDLSSSSSSSSSLSSSSSSSSSSSVNRTPPTAPVIVGIVGLAHVNSMLNVFNDEDLRQYAVETAGPSVSNDEVIATNRNSDARFKGIRGSYFDVVRLGGNDERQ